MEKVERDTSRVEREKKRNVYLCFIAIGREAHHARHRQKILYIAIFSYTKMKSIQCGEWKFMTARG